MPRAPGLPTWTGAPWTCGTRAVVVTASGTSRAGTGRIETTSGPEKRPAGVQGTSVRYMGTFVPASMWRTGTPASSSASSKEKLHPIRNETKSSRHNPRTSVGSSTSSPSR